MSVVSVMGFVSGMPMVNGWAPTTTLYKRGIYIYTPFFIIVSLRLFGLIEKQK